jgi:hypothetical protein
MACSARTTDHAPSDRAGVRRRVQWVTLTLAFATLSSGAVAEEPLADDRPAQARPRYGAATGLKPRPAFVAAAANASVASQASAGADQVGSSLALKGFVQGELARTIADPEHWSKMRVRGELTAQGRINEDVKWKLSGRLDYDAVYDVGNFYPPDVRRDQRLNLMARENYVDIAAAAWDFRLGRQHVVWGEVVGLFIADVVSAKDLREFLLPEFDVLRIPQWAARAEYSGEAFHAELLWIPVQSYDKIGKPGAEFFPAPPPGPAGFATVVREEVRPERTLGNTSYGTRVSTLQNGWDLSAFYYRSMDSTPTFYRQISLGPQPAIVYQPRHDRIRQFGSTVTKDLGDIVFKAEAVYTRGRQFNVTRATDLDGVVPQNTVDWVGGLDFALPANTRLNIQLFQRMFFDHDPDTITKRRETGYSAYLTHELSDRLEAQVLWISSLDRSDWMLRPRLVWKLEQNWRLTSGVDLFHGPPPGFFGRFANRDRAYAEVRYSF